MRTVDSQDLLAAFHDRYRAIEEELEGAASQDEALSAKRQIIELYHTLDGIERRFAELKKSLKNLVERFRALPAQIPQPAAGVAPNDPVPADRLGSSTYIEKAWSCLALEDYDGAIDHLHRALELAPGEPQVLSSLAWAQMMQEDFDEAMLTYQRVLIADPQDALSRVNLGYICLKKGIYGEAIEHLSKAIRSDRDRRATLYGHFYMGLVYLARQMYNDAEAFFEETIRLGPAMSEAYYHLGRTRYLAGQPDGALSTWEKGAAANRYGPWGKRCAQAADAVRSGQRPELH